MTHDDIDRFASELRDEADGAAKWIKIPQTATTPKKGRRR